MDDGLDDQELRLGGGLAVRLLGGDPGHVLLAAHLDLSSARSSAVLTDDGCFNGGVLGLDLGCRRQDRGLRGAAPRGTRSP